MNMLRLSQLAAIMLAAFLLAPSAAASSLDIGGGFGGVDCSQVKRAIRSDWMDVREFFRPGTKEMKRPRTREMYCVSPQYTRSAMSTRPYSFKLKCYTLQGSKFCCDERLQACAGMQ